ncbi:Signal transducer regulating beta-lactamase production, contains metallopeptidase domain [Paenibacillus sophorae]|uniref:M56 family metallopeptidase n=1 Tax=Paenibacillus sophorae TaxID=1333845 RepID=A0A1H8RTA4_9BACL|nr:M56 family metallopeptidase [Paenibacillus sophorae]QWU16991.1 M56 family metallopeptidase [Paenibacillus sophorae]SEO69582.1 Signal transducer regulating beta-lactamase production, contains metallopeptidase domain [Paenibacillus sophorae]
MSLLQISISTSVFILAVIFLRSLLIHKLPKMTFMFLWGVALIQLLVPVSVQSQFSIFTAVEHLSRMFTVAKLIPTPESSTFINGTTVIMPPITEHATAPIMPLKTASQISPIVWVWLVGFTLCALFFIIPHLRYRKIYKMAVPIRNDFIRKWQHSNLLWRDVQIRQLDNISTPLTYGIFRPVVLLPKNLDYDEEKQLALILTHEFTHIKRFDTLKKWILATSVCVHWFNPFVWVMYILANRDIELFCDETVIRKFGENTKPTYARALIRLEEKKIGLSPMISSFSKNSTEERIISIMKTKNITIATMLLAIGLVASVVIIFATSALDKTESATGVDNPNSEPIAEIVPALYQGATTTDLMPHDLTFNKKYDVPKLIDSLMASKYRAVYMDNEIYLRVMKDNTIQISKDNGAVWKKYDTDEIDAKDFAKWLLINDPIPGYSMKEVQSRLANGAEVKHLVFENVKEMYFIIDRNGVQIELVQPEKISSVLIDGQRMMITSAISAQMLKSFYDLLVSNNILSETHAKQDYSERIKYLEKNLPNFIVTK